MSRHLLVDTGPLVALLDRSDTDFQTYRRNTRTVIPVLAPWEGA